MPKDKIASAPDCTVAQLLNKRYCVTRILRAEKAFQIVKVVDVVANDVKVVKVISRAAVEDRKISTNITWLRSRRTDDGRRSMLAEDFKSPSLWCLVFLSPRMTLQDLLDKPNMTPLPRRHIREILLQVTKAVLALHRQSILHLDLYPGNVEIADASTVTEFVYGNDGSFSEKNVLRMAKVSIVFFGDAGCTRDIGSGVDQYRAPELVFGWVSKYRTDNFSIGCMFWEMLRGAPLFPPCPEGRIYMKSKAHLYAAILGEFPHDLRIRIASLHDGIFKRGSLDLHSSHDLPASIQKAVIGASDLQDDIDDEMAFEVFKNLTMLSAKDRLSLADVLDFPYFHVVS